MAGKNSNATSPGGTLPLLGWITNALKNSIYYKSIFVATSTETENDELMKFARQYEVHIFRGSEDDVFSRFNLIARNNDFDTIIRLTGDNPILDIKVLDNAIDYHLSSGAQYTITKGLPIGMNFEIIDVNSFINIDPDSLTIEEKEHVTLHMRSSGNFNIREYIPYPNIDYNKIRLTIDYPTDFIVVSCLISIGEYLNMKPGLGLIDYCIKNYPWLFEVNQQNHQKTNYKNLQEEWVRAEPILEKFEFKRIISLLKEKV
ncbi:cytidylyltransferase domain-containing protein [Antarcticibacterium arcticum]|uniref:cytidylyltransferase domain-containing protein n=1 Tax=Antarcticibacterium arcticum TaxID=2585771 RepID=UPI001F0DC600|nr:hypothetical protein [Antarcticibacterium arcticum]